VIVVSVVSIGWWLLADSCSAVHVPPMVTMRSVLDSRGASTLGARIGARRSVRGVVLVVGALLWAGCSGGEEGVTDLSFGAEPASSFVASTEAPAVSGRSVTATTAAPTTAVSSTTEAPAASSSPATSLETDEADAVIAAYLAAWQAFTDAAMDPTSPELRSLVESTRVGANLERALVILDELATNGWVAVEHPTDPARTTIEDGPFIDGDTATVVVCDLDSNIVIEPGAAPDGSDAMVNDSFTARRIEVTLARVDGQWKVSAGETIDRWPESSTCG
jgi:hypothetical protein